MDSFTLTQVRVDDMKKKVEDHRSNGYENLTFFYLDLSKKLNPQLQSRGQPTYSHQVWSRSAIGPRRR